MIAALQSKEERRPGFAWEDKEGDNNDDGNEYGYVRHHRQFGVCWRTLMAAALLNPLPASESALQPKNIDQLWYSTLFGNFGQIYRVCTKMK